MTDRTDARSGNAGDVTYWPDHTAPMTWHRCIVEGCKVKLDPWLHVTRCPEHQAEQNARLERVRAIVQANREAGRRAIDA